MRPLLISGCGRSGTAYTATVLSAAGYHCGHERIINIDRVGKLHPHHIESSGAAAPLLHEWPDAYVVHQVRHPLRVVASALARGFPKSRSGVWTVAHCPAIGEESTRSEQALRWWHDWNQLAEVRAEMRWQVESLTSITLGAALAESGRTADLDRLKAAMMLVPRDLNAQPDPPPRLTWHELPPGRALDDARALAKEYGYD
jgi:hypothetical protein